jgi:hypothetical protein
MAKAIEDKRKTFETNFGKMVCVVDPTLNLEFLKEIYNQYDSRGEEKVEMNFEKL